MTGLVLLGYAGLVVLVISLFPFSSPVAIAVEVLVAMVMLNRPRRRMQRAVNRRFHRLV
jgi:hypothetical protein